MNDLSLKARLEALRYSAYAYSYPHKTAYRPLAEPQPLRSLWAGEKQDALFLYVHVPFCEMRCGFCNLFTLALPGSELPARYVAQVLKQMQVVASELDAPRFARFALGGGTPTYLETPLLERLLEGASRYFALNFAKTPASVEVSPETASAEKLHLLKTMGITRVSMGVQSFFEQETATLIRRQENRTVQAALERIRHAGFEILNLDLIYGIEGQTIESFQASIAHAIAWRPEEIYLYPLYVRPQTGLDLVQGRALPTSKVFSRHQDGAAHREALYRHGRDALLAAGYEQVSMRMFRLPEAGGKAAPVYCCQEDGMIGLGCGARSYTRRLHYSSEYAVGRQATRDIIEHYCEQDAEFFAAARYGFVMSEAERQRRFVIQSLLTNPGLDLNAFGQHFGGADALQSLPLLQELVQTGLARNQGGMLELNEEGFALSDSIGPALISPDVWRLMNEFEVA